MPNVIQIAGFIKNQPLRSSIAILVASLLKPLFGVIVLIEGKNDFNKRLNLNIFI